MYNSDPCRGCRVNTPGYYRAALDCDRCIGQTDPAAFAAWFEQSHKEWQRRVAEAGEDIPFDLPKEA